MPSANFGKAAVNAPPAFVPDRETTARQALHTLRAITTRCGSREGFGFMKSKLGRTLPPIASGRDRFIARKPQAMVWFMTFRR
jgi:hypothetical protein